MWKVISLLSLLLILSCSNNNKPDSGDIEPSTSFEYDNGQRYTVYVSSGNNMYADSISVGCGCIEAFSGNKMKSVCVERMEITDRAGQYKKY